MKFLLADAKKHFRSSPIASSLLPPEITPARFHQALFQAVSELGDGEGVTTSGLLGRCWEILGVDFPQARQHCDSAVLDSLKMLKFLVEEFPGIGFHSAVGELHVDPVKHMNKVLSAIEARVNSQRKVPSSAKDRKLAVLEALGKTVEYVEDFKINGQKYHDGCFVLKMGEYWLLLVPTEFKTAGSKGVRAQMMVSMVRFVGVGIDSVVTFKRNGGAEVVPLHLIVTNPLYREVVGVKAGASDGVYAMSDAITESVNRRFESAHTTRNKLPRDMRTLFDKELPNYMAPATLIKVKADLLGMRGYIFNFLRVVPKRK